MNIEELLRVMWIVGTVIVAMALIGRIICLHYKSTRRYGVLSYCELLDLVERGVITADPANVNGSSIDITLGDTLLLENTLFFLKGSRVVDLSRKGKINTVVKKMTDEGYEMIPGQFLLASSVERFNLPDDISCEYKLKSSMARCGLEHLNAGWCDPYWHNSRLTLEFKNMNENHTLLLKPGMKIGQMVFFRHKRVPEHAGYHKRGQYNGQETVTESKGLR